eukprot:SAG31_NODE_35413_length_323_cov_0.919643_1_plen_57_part_01
MSTQLDQTKLVSALLGHHITPSSKQGNPVGACLAKLQLLLWRLVREGPWFCGRVWIR